MGAQLTNVAIRESSLEKEIKDIMAFPPFSVCTTILTTSVHLQWYIVVKMNMQNCQERLFFNMGLLQSLRRYVMK